MPRQARFPIGPLERLLYGSDLAKADQLGVNARLLYRWRHEGLTLAAADRCAIALGLHPALVWEDWYGIVDDGPEDLSDLWEVA